MEFVITKIGMQRALSITEGPSIALRIGKYVVCGKSYLGRETDVTRIEDVLHEGVPESLVTTPSGFKFVISLSETVGTWSFHTVAVLLEDGTVFAVGSLKDPQQKVARPDHNFNRIRLNVVVDFGSIAAGKEAVTTHETKVIGTIPALPGVDYLPAAPESTENVYAIAADSVPSLWLTNGTQWFSHSYSVPYAKSQVTDVSSDGLSFGAVLPDSLPKNAAIVCVETGASAGLVREVLSTDSAGIVSLSTALPLSVGDRVSFWVSFEHRLAKIESRLE